MGTDKPKKPINGGLAVLQKYGREHFVELANKRAEKQRVAMELWEKTEKEKLLKKKKTIKPLKK